jgi:hypothetical protein
MMVSRDGRNRGRHTLLAGSNCQAVSLVHQWQNPQFLESEAQPSHFPFDRSGLPSM